MTSLKQHPSNQECRTVTNHYLCQDCTIHAVKEWLTQKRQYIYKLHKCNGFCAECLEEHGAICDETKLIDKLLEELNQP